MAEHNEIDIVNGTISTPVGHLIIKRFARAKRVRVFDTTGEGDGYDEHQMRGTRQYTGSFTAIANQTFNIDDADEETGIIEIKHPGGSTSRYQAILQNLRDHGAYETGGPVYVSGQWVGRRISSTVSSSEA